MSEEPTAKPDSPPPPLRWRAIPARVSQVFGRLSCFAALVGSLSLLIYDIGEHSRMFVNTIGLLGLLFLFLGTILWVLALSLGTLAMLLGATSLVALWRRNTPTPVVRSAKVGFVLGCAGVAITLLSAMIIPELWNRKTSVHSLCLLNFQQIGACLEFYAEDNQGALPNKLSVLYPDYATGPEIFVCPASGNKPGDPAHIDEWTDYAYVPGLRMSGTPADAKVLVCYEKHYRHKHSTRSELYLDGHHEFHELGKPHQPSKLTHP